MRVFGLSLLQPWAQLMADGRKVNETRSFRAPLKAGEYIAIHSSKRMQAEDVAMAEAWGYDAVSLPFGSIVSVHRFLSCSKTENVRPAGLEAAYGNYEPGRWAWKTELVHKLVSPIPCRGMLGCWAPPAEVREELEAQLAAAGVRLLEPLWEVTPHDAD